MMHIHFENLVETGVFPSSSVEGIFQDSQGFLWFGSLNGLHRYDAHSYKSFWHDPEDPYSLSSNTVGTIMEDKNGILWVATLDAGLNAWHRSDGRFRRYQHDPIESGSIPHNRINDIHECTSGYIWIASNAGLSKLNPDNGKITNFICECQDLETKGPLNIETVSETADGIIWAGSRNYGLIRLDPANASHQFISIAEATGDNQLDTILDIAVDNSGKLWLGTNGGLVHYDRVQHEKTIYRHNPDDRTSLGSNAVTALYIDSREVLWIGSADSGLSVYDQSSNSFRQYSGTSAQADGFRGTWVKAITEDTSGAIWVATLNAGINKTVQGQLPVVTYTHNPEDSGSLSSSSAWGVMKDQEETLWVGTHGGGLNRRDLHQQGFIHYKHDPDDPWSISSNQIFPILSDYQGRIWVGTRRGLNRLDKESGKFYRYAEHPGDISQLESTWILSLFEDSKHRLWVGTYDQGLFCFSPNSNKIAHYSSEPDNNQSLSDNTVLSVVEDHQGILWIGTAGGGLNRFDPLTEIFKSFTPGEGQSISSNRVDQVMIDSNGQIWLATTNGLDLLNPDDYSIRNYQQFEHQRLGYVASLLEETEGILWIGTHGEGLARMETESGQIRFYDSNDGLSSNEFIPRGVLKDSFGRLYFSSKKGLISFNPAAIELNNTPPPVVFTEFLIFNTPARISTDSPLKGDINSIQTITLHQSHAVVSLEFSALNYIVPEKNRYAYRLHGFDRDWNYTDSNRRFATYTNLSPGRYRFQVLAANNDGVWNRKGRSINLVIRPYWWNSFWFYLVATSGTLLLSAAYLRFRMALIKEKLRNADIVRISEEKYRRLTDSITDMFFALDAENHCIYWNRTSAEIFDISPEKALGQPLLQLIKPGRWAKKLERLLPEIDKKLPFKRFTAAYSISGREYFLESSLFYRETGGVSVISKDVTDRIRADQLTKKSLREKEILIRELYHRTQNNMQIIESLLRLQTGRIESEAVTSLMQEVLYKIQAMALIHQMLYESEDLSEIVFLDYVRELASQMINNRKHGNEFVSFTIEGTAFKLLIDSAVPCGLVICELITNSLKHAFPDGIDGKIEIMIIKNREDLIELHYSDNGVGLSAEHLPTRDECIGIQTITALVEDQLKGQISYQSGPGLSWHILFRDDQYKKRV